MSRHLCENGQPRALVLEVSITRPRRTGFLLKQSLRRGISAALLLAHSAPLTGSTEEGASLARHRSTNPATPAQCAHWRQWHMIPHCCHTFGAGVHAPECGAPPVLGAMS